MEIDSNGGAYIDGDVKTGGGDFIGRDKIDIQAERVTVQYFAPESTDQESENWQKFLKENTLPYQGITPYSFEDRFKFTGRDSEINRVTNRIGNQRIVILLGEPDVGKTSLLAAGVVPKLQQAGGLVVFIPDYENPQQEAIDTLTEYSVQNQIELGPDPTLNGLAHDLIQKKGQGIVFILDQFERFFEDSEPSGSRLQFLMELTKIYQEMPPDMFRLIIAIRESARDQLDSLEKHFPNLWGASIYLQPLDRSQARQAIEYPLEELTLIHPAYYTDDLVETRLLPDLDDLTPKKPDKINPAELQIVCSQLFQAARSEDTRRINQALYDRVSHGKGAEGIMASHLETILVTKLAEVETPARAILAAMVEQDESFWIHPDQLREDGIHVNNLDLILDEMVEAEMLLTRFVGGQRFYAMASYSITRAALRLIGPEAQRQAQAREKLNLLWASWLLADQIPTREQVNALAAEAEDLPRRPVQDLMLLRAALSHNLAPSPWLIGLASGRGRTLVKTLEGLDLDPAESPCGVTTCSQGKLILGLEDGTLPPIPEGADWGPVSWAAAAHLDEVIRQTALLAIVSASGDAGIRRTEAALETISPQSRHLDPWIAFYGSLQELIPSSLGQQSFSRLLGLRIWWWRFRRRVRRDQNRLTGLAIGGALGGGLALAILRALIAAPAENRNAGVMFGLYFYWGFILGGALTLGVNLVDSLLLKPEGEQPKAAIASKKPYWWSILLGTIFFGLAQVFTAWLNGLEILSAPLVLPLGFLAGLGLSVGINGQPKENLRTGLQRAARFMIPAGLLNALAQAGFLLADNQLGLGITISWPGSFYRSNFAFLLQRWFPSLDLLNSPAFDYLGLLDAFLVGVVMTLGITWGLHLAARWLKNWRDLVTRADFGA